MVCCELVKCTKDKALYKYGGDYVDRSGLLEFDVKNGSFKIIQEAKKSITFIRHIRSVYYHHKDEFEKGIFKEKLYYINH